MLDFSSQDIFSSHRLTFHASQFLTKNLDTQWYRIGLLIFLPLIILSFATYYEGVFILGSVTFASPEHGQILGMSFLGDTMVWPFCILVPLLLKFVVNAASHTANTLNRLTQQIYENWPVNDRPDNLERVVNTTRNIFKGEHGISLRIVKYLPYIVAASFWIYNTTTCAFHDYLPEKYYPYKSSHVTVLSDPVTGSHSSVKLVQLDELLALPKWDCNRKHAPWSTGLTRIWTLFYYGLPPFLLAQLILMIAGLSYYLKHFRQWAGERKYHDDQDTLLVKPFADDGYGGLGFIANTGMAYFYTSFFFVLLVLMSYFKEGAAPSWHNYLLIIILIPITLLTFIIPALAVRDTIKDAKDRYLDFLCHHSNHLFGEILHYNDDNKLHFDHYHSKISSLKIFYDQVEKMAVWPFSTSALLKISFTAIMPLLAAGLELYLKSQ
ncbi:MAG: hypothetical protein ABW139_06715 [Candidatus Thiodiazotropha sp. DIVDIV]